ncbi:MAG: hypothetical protein WAU82_13015 [Candidatus Binatus sp.]|uniref:hypothetical protein n=1 Tax=Candidatus Binatus sp. TaxID=2811406 RepID=UPI003BB05F0A
MATDNESYLELFDVSKKKQVGKAPLASIRFIPRIGERIFLPLDRPGHWHSYTVVSVEYFLGNRSPSEGMDRVTLYVEESK